MLNPMEGKPMEITLAPEQEKIVRRLMDSGEYENEDAAVAEALRILEVFDFELMMPRAVVHAQIQKGIDELDRGEGKPWSLDDFVARARERRAKKAPA
ncbi:hypothetical protein HOI71_25140 [Candidatus Poribacteria bacterium]|jgi:Arc/MetJ-type ribon-helix-helix transcriptional regulator|nr:hypothetical protein [Candidatus Poribacteria bacterium]MBT7097539.1 hypothetical protein [Candidatus Poribacteria bacterium]